MNTLLLDRTRWDLVLDARGNIALASNPYAVAQNVASAVRTFAGECYYNTSLGLPYFSKILGARPSISLIKGAVEKAALSVPDVAKARCIIAKFENRVLTGVVEIIDTKNQALNVTF